jgi:hypothetical protein
LLPPTARNSRDREKVALDFSPSSLIAGLVFGVIGLSVFRLGKRDLNFPLVFTGLTLMIYPYFTPNAWLTWGVGVALCVLSYYLR